jgi:hypothetical protein
MPQAKVIHIIRDGRDQAVSMMHHLWNRATVREGRYDLEPEEVAKRNDFYKNRRVPLADGEGIFTKDRLMTVAGYWAERVGKTVEDGPTLLGNRYTQVKYEDLLKKPEEEMRRLFEFLGADTSEETVYRCVKSADFEELSGRKRGSEDYELGWKKQRKGVAGDWKNVFTERDKAIYKEVAGDLLINLGYAKDNNW